MPVLCEEVSVYPETLLEEEETCLQRPINEFPVREGDSPIFPVGELGQSPSHSSAVPLQPSNRRWWVLYTKARQEKAVARRLLGFEIPFYLPLVSKSSVYRGRRVFAHIPLFSGYVFLYGSEEERVQSLTTNRISRVLPVHDPCRLWHDLRQIHRLIAAKVPLTVEARLAPGNRVRVRYGPFAGLEGTVLTRRGQTRLVVSVDFLQKGASVEIDDFMLEPIDSDLAQIASGRAG